MRNTIYTIHLCEDVDALDVSFDYLHPYIVNPI
jgi:hypothetical protein